VARFAALLRCAHCHEARQPEQVHGVVDGSRRATDASGLYSLLATLDDQAVVDTYRPVDPNSRNPNITRRCRETPCGVGAVQVATLHVAHGLATRDPHTLALCAARRALGPWLGEDVRRAYQHELAECGVDM
jgi:hypothetical protein